MSYPESRWYMFPQPMVVGDYTLEFQHPFVLENLVTNGVSKTYFWHQGDDVQGIPISEETSRILEKRSTAVALSVDKICTNRRINEEAPTVNHERNSEGRPLQISGGIDEGMTQIEGSRAKVGDAKYFLRAYAAAPTAFDLGLIVDAESARASGQGIDVNDESALKDIYPALYWAKTYLELRDYQKTKGVNVIPAPTDRSHPAYATWFTGTVDSFQDKQYYINLIDKKGGQASNMPNNLILLFGANSPVLPKMLGISDLFDRYLKDDLPMIRARNATTDNMYRYGVEFGLRAAASVLIARIDQVPEGMTYAEFLEDSPELLTNDRNKCLTSLAFLKAVIDGTIVDYPSFTNEGRIDMAYSMVLTNRKGVPNRVDVQNPVIAAFLENDHSFLANLGTDRQRGIPKLNDWFSDRVAAQMRWSTDMLGAKPATQDPESWKSGMYQDAKFWLLNAVELTGYSYSSDPRKGNYATVFDKSGTEDAPVDYSTLTMDQIWEKYLPERQREAMLSTISSLKVKEEMNVDNLLRSYVQFGLEYVQGIALDSVRARLRFNDGVISDDRVAYLMAAMYTYHLTPKGIAKAALRSYFKSDLFDKCSYRGFSTGADWIKWVQSHEGQQLVEQSGWSPERRNNNVVTDAIMQVVNTPYTNVAALKINDLRDAKDPIVAEKMVAYFKQMANTIIDNDGFPNYSKADVLIDHGKITFLVGTDHRFVNTDVETPENSGGGMGHYVSKKPTNEPNGVHIPFMKMQDNKTLLANLSKICNIAFENDRTPRLLLPSIIEDLDKHSKHLGLKKPLPMRNVLMLDGDAMGISTRVLSLPYGGQTVAIIVINSRQLAALFGGFNTSAVLQALTHEIAHYYEKSYIKNADRLRFEKALGHKQLFPTGRNRSGGAADNKSEQFAMLAEYMVWGSCARSIYYANGVETVLDYFHNQYMTEEMLAYKR